jgi:hypothetical protein
VENVRPVPTIEAMENVRPRVPMRPLPPLLPVGCSHGELTDNAPMCAAVSRPVSIDHAGATTLAESNADGKRPALDRVHLGALWAPADRDRDRRRTSLQFAPAHEPANSTDLMKAQTEAAPNIEERHEFFSRGRNRREDCTLKQE